RIIRTAYYEGSQYVPLVQDAFILWRQLERESGSSLLTMTGALMIGRPEGGLVSGTLASVQEHGLAHELLDADRMRERYPQHRLLSGEVAVYEEAAGFLRPEDASRAAVRRAESLGATVLRRTPVEKVETGTQGVRVTAGGRTYQAGHAVVSMGAWLGGFLPALQVPLTVERQVVGWFPLRTPELYSPQRCPVFMHETETGRYRYGFPSLDGTTVKMAVHHEGTTTSPDAVDRTVHPEDLAPIQSFVREWLVGIEPVAVRSQVCLYTNTPDAHFVVGPLPGVPAVTVLGGFSGHGFKFAPVLGDVAADLALQGRTDYPIDLFEPGRFAAGLPLHRDQARQ
ncbi:MAG TPA: N-methyl-L-tryptophan oxidase, partial [Chloroflexota bacterium]|nr:N-methyl-L-tryptophan oxidase [Chloroflexota bacterium]